MTERLYYSDSFLRTFSARVTDVRLHSQTAGQSTWQISLDRSAFYPTSGGQPHDTGSVTATSRNGAVLEIPVEAVEEDEKGEVWHTTAKPLPAGTEITGEIDWERRLDHMQQHSGQHLLSAVFARELKAITTSFHLGQEVSTIDLAIESVAQHSLERVTRTANEIIAEDRPVTVRTISSTEAESLLKTGALRKLPPRTGDMRLIEIADYDLNACGGTHVRSTGQIGGLYLRGTERVRQGIRIEFVSGLRAAASARRDYLSLTHAAAALSTPRQELSTAIQKLQSEAKAGQKEREKLREELARYHATSLAVEEHIHNGLREVVRRFPDRDAAYIKLLASRLIASVPQTVGLFVSTQQDPATIVVARSSDLGFHCGDLVKSTLADIGLRGGGSADLAQGQLPVARVDTILASLSNAIRDFPNPASGC